jgi:hypothetical protein
MQAGEPDRLCKGPCPALVTASLTGGVVWCGVAWRGVACALPCLLDDLDHATDPAKKTEVVQTRSHKVTSGMSSPGLGGERAPGQP